MCRPPSTNYLQIKYKGILDRRNGAYQRLLILLLQTIVCKS